MSAMGLKNFLTAFHAIIIYFFSCTIHAIKYKSSLILDQKNWWGIRKWFLLNMGPNKNFIF